VAGRPIVVAGGAVWRETVGGGAGVGGITAAGPRIRYQAPAPPAAINTVATSIIDDDEAEARVVGSAWPQFGQAVTTVLTTVYWHDGQIRSLMRHLAMAKRPQSYHRCYPRGRRDTYA
jgi:hypothetical protein